MNTTRTTTSTLKRSLFIKSRRGAACVASAATLVFFQLLIVGTIIAGAREQDVSVHRINAARAFYAAEGGINMAVRELMANGGAGTDFDGDTVVGSISNNADSTDNPQIDSARCVVSRAGSLPPYTLTSDASSGASKSRVNSVINLDLAGGRRIIYGQWSNTYPQYRIWTGTQWGNPTNTLDFGAKVYWPAIRRCPIRQEIAVACVLQSGDLKAAVQKGLVWGNLISLTNDCGTTTSRAFSLGYEQTSGDALVVYRRQNQSTMYYRTWNGTAWSAESSFNTALGGRPLFLKLVPKRNSDEMMFYAIDDNNDIIAAVWNGSSFGNEITLETNYLKAAVNIDNECIDAAYEMGTGRCMLVWGRTLSLQPVYRIWDGSAWLSEASMPLLSGAPVWPRLTSDRASNSIICGVLGMTGAVTVNTWNGSTWGSTLLLESGAPTLGSRCFDVSYEPAGTRALVMWSRGSLLQPRYRTFNGSSWSAEATGPTLTNVSYLTQMIPSRNGSEIMIGHNERGGQNNLSFMRWDGTGLVNQQVLEINLSGPVGAEVFMIPDDPQGIIDPLRVFSWAPSEP